MSINNLCITKDLIIKIKKDDVKLSTKPYVFKGDTGIIFEISVNNWNFYFDNSPNAEVDIFTEDCKSVIEIVKPDGKLTKLVDVPIIDNEIQFKINKNISDIVGVYKIYVKILKGDTVIATIPPFDYEVKDKPNFDTVLPMDRGFLQVEDSTLLCYDTVDSYGIKRISELTKTDTQKDQDELIIQQNGITHCITVKDFMKSSKATMNEYTDSVATTIRGEINNVDTSLKGLVNTTKSELNQTINTKNTEAKQYTDTKLVEGKGYTDQKIKDLVGLAPPELDTLKEIGDFAKENKTFIDGFVENLNSKADKTHVHGVATERTNGFMSSDDFNKLKGIATNANNYTHPKTHQASIIVQDATHKFVTDEEKTKWTNIKLDTVSIEGQEIVFKAENVEKFRLPLPKGFSGDYNDLTNKPEAYQLPIASDTVLGGVKLGVGFEKQDDGTINVVSGGKADSVEWDSVLNKPVDFKPSKHNHTKDEITGLFIVENELTSNSTTNALSVAQGKVINDKVEGINTKVADLIKNKHTHSNKADLDKVTNEKITSWDNKSDNGHKHTKAEITDMFNVVDNLTSESTTDALSAKQGKVLDDRLKSIEQGVASVHTHANKVTIDKITEEKLTQWDNKETTEGSQAKATKALEDAKAYVDSKAQVRKAFSKTVQTNEFGSVENGLYSATVNHNLNTDKILISALDNTTKENVLISYKIVDNNNIKVSCEVNTPLDITIIDANLSAPIVASGGGSGEIVNPNYQNYRIEYNALKDSLDFIYSPVG